MNKRFDGCNGYIDVKAGTLPDGVRWVTIGNGDQYLNVDEWASDAPEQIVALKLLAAALGEAADFLEGTHL